MGRLSITRDSPAEGPPLDASLSSMTNDATQNMQSRKAAPFSAGGSLFQGSFFFCAVKGFGDLAGTGCIYVETVVDAGAGIAFAKVYAARNPANAVDILETRVVPFFQRQGTRIREIRTRKTAEYCGLLARHPYEMCLATSRIRHAIVNHGRANARNVCAEFSALLEKEFLQPALRSQFQFSLAELQRQLDSFLEAYNARTRSREIK